MMGIDTVLTRIIKQATETCTSQNRFDLMQQVGEDIEKWCHRYRNNKKYQTEIEKIQNMSSTEILNEIDKFIISAMDNELNKAKEPRFYGPN